MIHYIKIKCGVCLEKVREFYNSILKEIEVLGMNNNAFS